MRGGEADRVPSGITSPTALADSFPATNAGGRAATSLPTSSYAREVTGVFTGVATGAASSSPAGLSAQAPVGDPRGKGRISPASPRGVPAGAAPLTSPGIPSAVMSTAPYPPGTTVPLSGGYKASVSALGGTLAVAVGSTISSSISTSGISGEA